MESIILSNEYFWPDFDINIPKNKRRIVSCKENILTLNKEIMENKFNFDKFWKNADHLKELSSFDKIKKKIFPVN